MEKQLLILLSEEEAEPERVAELTSYLREELLDLDVDDVTALPGVEAPPGTRAVDVTQIGSLLVALGGSATALSQVVNAVRSWLDRFHDSRPSLRLEMDGDAIEVSKATDEQIAEAFRVFVQQHATPGARS
ncbi:effector-associated constant component EACC1 [Streptomyces sp. 900105755]|uniref:effector-associated constant component EACC1 n=1 Tax=Streptomyces sp. NPDC021562 TaxID=3155121 RepID=UPI001A9F54EE